MTPPLRVSVEYRIRWFASLLISLMPAGILLQPAVAGSNPCGLSEPCSIAGPDAGTYHLAFPDDWDGRRPLKPFVFFHGHGGSGVNEIRNRLLVTSLTRHDYLFVAPDGPMFNFRGTDRRGWAARLEGATPRGKRDDIKFVEAVLADVARRVPLSPAQTVVSGFSSGGSMAWYFSCYSKLPLAGVVAIAGGLRRPLPAGGVRQEDGSIATQCPGGPRTVLHIHGFSDRQVPLEGRGIRAWHQGDVFEGLAVQRSTNRCDSRPDAMVAKGEFWCRTWNTCQSGKPVRFCLHAGGHGFPKDAMQLGLDFLAPKPLAGR